MTQQYKIGSIDPHLTINGNPIKIGDKFWTVNKETLQVRDHIADGQNNVSYQLYFDNQKDAVQYSCFNSPRYSVIDFRRYEETGVLEHIVEEYKDYKQK